MKKFTTLLIILVFLKCNSQVKSEFNGKSGISIEITNKEELNKLSKLGRVWGFMKYHHPEITSGNYNWDDELFLILPSYLKTENKIEEDSLLTKWILDFGPLSPNKTLKIPSSNSLIKPNHDWWKNYSKELQIQLQTVYESRNNGDQYYVKLDNISKPVFNNEATYADQQYPDDGCRLLSVYRYWNTINYFFPSKYLTDNPWDSILEKYINLGINAQNELEYELAILQLTTEIDDSHAYFHGDIKKTFHWKGLYFSPVQIKYIENKYIVTNFFIDSISSKLNIKKGDAIAKINNKDVTQILKEKKKYYPSSNLSEYYAKISLDLLRSEEKQIDITLSREGVEFDIQLPLFIYADLNPYYSKNNKKSYELRSDNIGYINIGNLQRKDINELKKKLYNSNGIIIDLRIYPKDFTVFKLGSFLTDEKTPFVKFLTGNTSNPGEFTFESSKYILPKKNTFKGPVILIINEATFSSGEYHAMAFKSGKNVIAIGSKTAGADGNISEIVLPGNLKSNISGLGVYYPDGTETQRIGIVPDIEIKPTVQGIVDGRDELMEKAIDLIKNYKL